MSFALNDDQVAIRDMARAFADEKIAPHALKWDEERHFPVDVIREAAGLGMAGIYVREDVGGSGLTRLDAALIMEQLAAGYPGGLGLYLHPQHGCMDDQTGLAPSRYARPGFPNSSPSKKFPATA